MNKTIQRLSPLTEATYYILLSVQTPNHGYGIIKQVEELTKGRLILAAGTLYGAIQNLIKYKCIDLFSVTESNKNKKEYVITDLGRDLLKYELKRISGMIEHAKQTGVTI